MRHASARHVHAQPRRPRNIVRQACEVIDVHAHCAVPEAMGLMGLKFGGPTVRPDLSMTSALAERIAAMDSQGIDMEVLSINPYCTSRARSAEKIIQIQNENSPRPARRIRTVPRLRAVALQHPTSPPGTRRRKSTTCACRHRRQRGRLELSDPKLHPFWPRPSSLGVRSHPSAGDSATRGISMAGSRARYLSNVVAFPLETTIALSIWCRRYRSTASGLKICAAHGGGYLPFLLGRSDHGCLVRPTCARRHPRAAEEKPTDYVSRCITHHGVPPEGVRHLAAEVGASQLMIGTDYLSRGPTAVEEVMATPG